MNDQPGGNKELLDIKRQLDIIQEDLSLAILSGLNNSRIINKIIKKEKLTADDKEFLAFQESELLEIEEMIDFDFEEEDDDEK